MFQDRIQREKAFHDKRFGEVDDPRVKAEKYYSIIGSISAFYRDLVSKYCNGKRLLEYGCGTGGASTYWLKRGAVVTGIDISHEAIKKAKATVSKAGLEASYHVMNAEKTEFGNSHFDVIVGSGILHHLDLNNSYAELSRILDEDGHAIFIEPLGSNPLINFYRDLTPSMRSEDEHPLTQKDIQLAKQYFSCVDTYYFSLFSIMAVLFKNKKSFEKILNILESFDRSVMFIFPFFKKYCWTVILHMSNPKKT